MFKVFQWEIGICVVFDIFDSVEIVQGKLMVGCFGYDVVVIIFNILFGLIKVGVFQEFDCDWFFYWKNFDVDIFGKFQVNDFGNCYVVFYFWGIIGIVYDVDKVCKLFGFDVLVDFWDLVFKEENIFCFSQCGVVMLDFFIELVFIVFNYLGLLYNSQKFEDYQKVQELLLKVCFYICYFDFFRVDIDFFNGNVCVVVGWQGMVYMVQVNNEQVGNGCYIVYSIFWEGLLVWIENMVLFKDVLYLQQGYVLIDYLLCLEVIVRIFNYVGYLNGNQVVLLLVEWKLWENLVVYLSKEIMVIFFLLEILLLKVERICIWVWSWVKIGS